MPNKVVLSPPPNFSPNEEEASWKTWYNSIHTRVGEGPFLIQGFEKANLPDADQWGSTSSSDPFSAIIFVRDNVIPNPDTPPPDTIPQPTLAFSDGTNWISVITGETIA